MLDRLRRGDESGVQNLLVLNLATDFIRFFEDPVNGRTIDLLRLRAVHLEHLLDALHLSLGVARDGLQTRT